MGFDFLKLSHSCVEVLSPAGGCVILMLAGLLSPAPSAVPAPGETRDLRAAAPRCRAAAGDTLENLSSGALPVPSLGMSRERGAGSRGPGS